MSAASSVSWGETMTMHADQLVGAPVIDSEGQAVGTIEQVFRDDVDGTPSWARIRSGKRLHFVPLAGGSMTSGGDLSVPFDAQKIMKEPDLNVDRHLSVQQEEELRRYFGMTVPAQPQAGPEQGAGPGPGPGQARDASGTTRPDLATPPSGTTRPAMAKPSGTGQQAGTQQSGQEWLVRSEERFAVNTESRESGRIKLRKRVETEQVQQKVQVFHEEYEIERIPVSKDDKVTGEIADRDQEIILHETRAVVTKETVPVERVRLSVKRVEEEQTISDQLRKERIEIDNGTAGDAGTGQAR